MVTVVGPNHEFKYELTIEGCGKLVLRDLTPMDIFWIADMDLDFADNLSILALLVRLLEVEEFDIGELSLSQYTSMLKHFAHEVLNERIMSPENLLEILYFLGGQSFTPNIEDWFTKPLCLILQLAEVVKKYPKQTL